MRNRKPREALLVFADDLRDVVPLVSDRKDDGYEGHGHESERFRAWNAASAAATIDSLESPWRFRR